MRLTLAIILATSVVIVSTQPLLAADGFEVFFNKNVVIHSAWCLEGKKDAECMPRPDATPLKLSFDATGTLSEAFLCGDPHERHHVFGSTHTVKKSDDFMKVTCDLTLSGTGNSIKISTRHKLKFRSGDSSDKTESLELTSRDGKTCKVLGTRQIVDMPEDVRSKLRRVTLDCLIE